MSKIYIAGPMTGLKNFNKESFIVAEYWLRAVGHDTRNPAILPHNWNNPKDYMTIDLAMLATCDSIVFLPGWRQSRGAKIEFDEAARLNIEMIYPFTDDIKSVLETLHRDASNG